jgi:hypothetical protein
VAERFDVAARLAEGRPAVEHTQTYVRACHALGYQQPDLTAHDAQVCDWYETETGLDLRALDDDSAELAAAVNAIEEALHLQRAKLAELASAWRGPGADSAMRFLQRHCDTATAVAAHVGVAADGCAALRDNLWEMVDSKVTAAIAIDDRRLGERPAWLAAAHTVTTGTGDRPAAEELVHWQVNPYVDNDIRTDWVAAMRSTAASVAASYDAIIRALTSTPEACFDIPGELGPSRQSASDDLLGPSSATPTMPVVSLPADTVSTLPAAASIPLAPTTAAPPPLPADAPADLSSVPPGSAAPVGSPVGDSTGLPTGTGNLGGLAGNIGGVVGKIVDGIGGLLGSLADGFADSSGSEDRLPDAEQDPEEPLAEQADDDTTDDEPDDAGGSPVCGDAVELAGADEDATCEPPGEGAPDADDANAAQQVTPPPMDTPPMDTPLCVGASPVALPPDDPPPAASGPPPEGGMPGGLAVDELPQAGQ